MRGQGCVVWGLFFAGAIAARAGIAETITVNDAGDAGNGTCTTVCTLRDAINAIAVGGTINFAPSILPATIMLQQHLTVSKSLLIQGPGPALLTVSGKQFTGALPGGVVFIAGPGPEPDYVTVSIYGLTLRDGTVVGANGPDGAAASGNNGTAGGTASGGCMYVKFASVTLTRVRMQNCVAQGGNGGKGGSGTPSPGGLTSGGPGGAGGNGGSALGGAIAIDRPADLFLIDTSVFDAHAIGGDGADGGDGGTGFYRGAGGNGGSGGAGYGGVVSALPRIVFVENSTIARGSTQGGNGGNGGLGDPSLVTVKGGNGGNAGSGDGGLVYVGAADFPPDFDFATLAEGEVTAGAPGSAGTAPNHGTDGQPGHATGAAINSYAYSTIRSTAIVSASTHPLCEGGGTVAADSGTNNLAQDMSCGANLFGSLAVQFRPLAESAALPFYMPLHTSAVIDAANSCEDSDMLSVIHDGQSTPRPQGVACDIGAIEADYVFVGEFD